MYQLWNPGWLKIAGTNAGRDPFTRTNSTFRIYQMPPQKPLRSWIPLRTKSPNQAPFTSTKRRNAKNTQIPMEYDMEVETNLWLKREKKRSATEAGRRLGEQDSQSNRRREERRAFLFAHPQWKGLGRQLHESASRTPCLSLSLRW